MKPVGGREKILRYRFTVDWVPSGKNRYSGYDNLVDALHIWTRATLPPTDNPSIGGNFDQYSRNTIPLHSGTGFPMFIGDANNNRFNIGDFQF